MMRWSTRATLSASDAPHDAHPRGALIPLPAPAGAGDAAPPVGQALQDLRIQRGLSLLDCEAQLHIRAKFLAAIEADREDLLPEPTYARIFVRGYATFLGADADALVRELDRRTGETISQAHVLVGGQGPEPERSTGLGYHIAAWCRAPRYRGARIAIVVVVAIAVLGWLGYRAEGSPGPRILATPALGTENLAPPTTPPPTRPAPATRTART